MNRDTIYVAALMAIACACAMALMLILERAKKRPLKLVRKRKPSAKERIAAMVRKIDDGISEGEHGRKS